MNIKNTLVLILTSTALFIGCKKGESEVLESNCTEITLVNYDTIWTDDYYVINDVSLNGIGELLLNISHSGGCEEHEFQLLQEPIFCGTPPIFITIKLSHNANSDTCEGWITRDLCFDISSIYSGNNNTEITVGLMNTHQEGTIFIIE